jgi:beta-lactamase regulating signal transducer with metallopeptidase domain
MMVAQEVVSAASQMATSALAAALWQGALLAGAAALGLRLLPETPAPVRFSIWFAVFLLVAGVPFATVSLAHGGAGAVASMSHPWLTVDARWCVWIAAIWAAASLVRGITLVAAAFRVRVLWKRAEPIDVAFPTVKSRNAQVCVSDEVDRPTVIGFFSPKIVIPEWLIGKLTPEELEQVVLHEAGHLSRGDDWLNLLQKVALVIFPLNPALAWVERRLCFERELACDESVLNATGAPKAYAECLAALAEYRLQRRGLVRGLALALGALGRESELTQRVLRILSGGTRMKRSQARMVLGGATLSLVFAATALERSPQLVGFTHAAAPASSGPRIAVSNGSGLREVAVRASVAPAEQWKTVGDAAPRIARRPAVKSSRAITPMVEARVTTPAPNAVMAKADVGGIRSAALRTRYDAAAQDKANTEVPSASSGQTLRSAQDDNSERTGGNGCNGFAPRMIQTVATTQQVTSYGDVVVTRWVTVTAVNASTINASALNPLARGNNRSDGSAQPAEGRPQQSVPIQQQQQVRPYAAVPVQGGWLVFQL